MKKLLSLFALVFLYVAAIGQEQSPEMVRFLQEFPQRAGFNTHSYEFIDVVDTPAPEGYKPFYISHYGRHGSRSDWEGDRRYKPLIEILSNAKAHGVQFTPAGDSLFREVQFIYAKYDGMDGRLTPRGVREHARLADRMYHRFPEVFQQGSRQIRAVSSIAPRCLISMNSFTAQLRALQPDLNLDLDSGEKFYDYIAQGENKTIKARTRKYASQLYDKLNADIDPVLKTLFRNPDEARKYIPKPDSFVYYIFETAREAEAYDIEDNLFRYLPFDLVYKMHALNYLKAYLNQCNSALNGDLRIPLNKPLVDSLLVQAERVITGASDRAADLTFGHDWPFLGLCSYLGLEGIGDRLTVEEAAARWMASWNCPFAANLQMIFYRSDKAEAPVLVKFLVNERETAIPALTAVAGPYYNWQDVKAFCDSRVPHTQIVAHRGFWDDNAQNSIASLAKAQDFGCWGSEFDLHLTADDQVVVHHDQHIGFRNIHKSQSDDIRSCKLKNKEPVPTLKEYLAQGAQNRDCVLVLELKPHSGQDREDRLIQEVLSELKDAKLLNPKRVAFISFSYYICKELARKCPGFTVQYLDGDKAPAEVHADGINGIDYNYTCFQKHPEWVKEAHELGMSVNVWTVDSPQDIRRMMDLGVDQITTDAPALTRDILFGRK